LLRHRRSPVSPDRDTRPDREREAGREQREPDRLARPVGVHTVPGMEHAEAGENDRHDDEYGPDARLASPRNATPLPREGRDDPVRAERGPADLEDELDQSHQ